MKQSFKLLLTAVLLLVANNALAQSADDAQENLRMAALEALISAPPERALPIVDKVLSGDHGTELKERALFILSQIETPESQQRLLAFARDAEGELQAEAVRMIGISGDEQAIASLADIYRGANAEIKEAVLEAYLIADDADAVLAIASSTENEEEFEQAVEMLGAMGASEQLRELRSRAGMSESLIHAYAISGDTETLRQLALDDSNIEMQKQAIEGLGIAGGDNVGETLVEIYRGAQSEDIRESALEGLLIADHDAGVLDLYRAATDSDEKRRLLEQLVVMDSDEVWDLIDSALDGQL